MTQPNQTPPSRAEELVLEVLEVRQLRLDVIEVIDDVAALAGFVDALTEVRQRRLGILTPAAEEIQNQQVRDERRDRRRAQRHGLPTGTGHVRAPGSFAGIAAATEVWATLQHQIRRANRHLESRRVCSLARLPHRDPTVHDLARVLAHQVLLVDDRQVLAAALADLRALAETTERFVDGIEGATPVNADCPHCGRRSLIARFNERLDHNNEASPLGDFIRCEREPRARHFRQCICSDPLCECKTRPISFRHVWHHPRPGGPVPSWYALRDRLTLTRITKESPAMKNTRRPR